jgi:galactosylceramidase
VGLLEGGGSYVSLTNSTALTIVIETMPFNSSQCSWSTSPTYTVSPQTVTFQVDSSSFPDIKGLYLTTTNLSNEADTEMDFQAQGLRPLTNGAITLTVMPEMLYTLSTINSRRGDHPTPPPATAFPFPYRDDFNEREVDSEAMGFIDQTGSWQIFQGDTTHGRVMRQQVLAPPVAWCGENPVPYSVIGSHAWVNVNVTVKVMIEGTGMAFVGARVSSGGCIGARGSSGVAFGVSTDGWWALCNSTAVTDDCIQVGKLQITAGTWYTLSLVVQGTTARAYIDGTLTVTREAERASNGWASIGSSWSYVQFDDFQVTSPTTEEGHRQGPTTHTTTTRAINAE